MTSPSFSTRAAQNSLEEAFFLRQDQKLLERLRALQKMEESKKTLAEVSGITNDAVLEKLLALSVSPQIAASLAVVPLIEVAWADGKVDEGERSAILACLESAGVPRDGIEGELVASWLAHRPSPNLLEAWETYVRALCEKLSEAERLQLEGELLRSTRAVAEASGGFAGLRRVSGAERDKIEALKSAFRC